MAPVSERCERLDAWFHRRNQRPLVGFTLGTYYPLKRYPRAARRIPEGAVCPEDIGPSDYLDDTDELYKLHEEAGGDLLWSAAPFLGVPWVEAALGCGVVADHGTGSMRSMPPPGFAGDPVVPEFSESNAWVRKLLDFIPALEARSAGRYPVGATLMRGISDLLSALYGGENFVLRLHDDPGEVRAVIEKVTDFWIAFGKCMLDRLPLFHGGTGCYLYCAWCPGKTIWFQEDAVALLSPALYREFIYPADRRITEAFEHTAVHLHPTRYVPTGPLLETAVDVIELHIDHDGPRARALEAHYRAVLEAKPLLIWGDLTGEDLDFILGELPAPGLAVNVLVPDVETAWQVAARIRRSLRVPTVQTEPLA